jgi:hypothetical protein
MPNKSQRNYLELYLKELVVLQKSVQSRIRKTQARLLGINFENSAGKYFERTVGEEIYLIYVISSNIQSITCSILYSKKDEDIDCYKFSLSGEETFTVADFINKFSSVKQIEKSLYDSKVEELKEDFSSFIQKKLQ